MLAFFTTPIKNTIQNAEHMIDGRKLRNSITNYAAQKDQLLRCYHCNSCAFHYSGDIQHQGTHLGDNGLDVARFL